MSFRLSAAVFVGFPAVLAACGNGSSLARAPGPELDLHTSCVAKSEWTRAATNDCSTCVAHATVPACDCTSNEPYNGVCNDAEVALANDADCTQSLDTCVASCAAGDCTCFEGCYTSHDSCSATTAHALSCLIDACSYLCS